MIDLQRVAADLAIALDRANIGYMIIGGLAVAVWGNARATMDVDVAISTSRDDISSVLTALGGQIKDMPPDAAAFASDTGILPFRHRLGVLVDLGFGDHPYVLRAIERAVVIELHGVGVKFCSAEDLILHKLIADRDRDRDDIKGIIKRQGRKLDRAYLDALVHELAEATSRSDLEEQYRSHFSRNTSM